MPRKLKSKYNGVCKCGCGKKIRIGDEVVWVKGLGSFVPGHEETEPQKPTPPPPSPGAKPPVATPVFRPDVWQHLYDKALEKVLVGHPDQFMSPGDAASRAAGYADAGMVQRGKRGMK